MPLLTEAPRPNGFPRAITVSPEQEIVSPASLMGLNFSPALTLDFQRATSLLARARQDFRRQNAVVRKFHGDFVGVFDDMNVRKHVTILVDDHAGPGGHLRRQFLENGDQLSRHQL